MGLDTLCTLLITLYWTPNTQALNARSLRTSKDPAHSEFWSDTPEDTFGGSGWNFGGSR